MRVHRMQGLAQMLAGRLDVAFSHYAVVLDLYSEARHASLRFQNASDQGAVAHAHMAWGKAIARCPKSSTHHAERALALASRLQHPHTSAHVMCVLAARAQTVGERHNASALAFAGKSLSQRYEFPYWLAWANIILGWAQVDRGGDGLAKIDAAIKSYARTGAQQAVLMRYSFMRRQHWRQGGPNAHFPLFTTAGGSPMKTGFFSTRRSFSARAPKRKCSSVRTCGRCQDISSGRTLWQAGRKLIYFARAPKLR